MTIAKSFPFQETFNLGKRGGTVKWVVALLWNRWKLFCGKFSILTDCMLANIDGIKPRIENKFYSCANLFLELPWSFFINTKLHNKKLTGYSSVFVNNFASFPKIRICPNTFRTPTPHSFFLWHFCPICSEISPLFHDARAQCFTETVSSLQVSCINYRVTHHATQTSYHALRDTMLFYNSVSHFHSPTSSGKKQSLLIWRTVSMTE